MTSEEKTWDQGEPVYRRDGWICQYCGLDGTASFANWCHLSWDHLLPKSHEDRDAKDNEYVVTACRSCNELLSHYFKHAQEEGEAESGQSREDLVMARKQYLEARRIEYFRYWLSVVAPEKQLLREPKTWLS